MIRWYVISAVFKRNVMSYFSGLLGYLFIIVFVVASTYFAFQPEFFTDNMPTLDHLTAIFPWLLLFIVPAITMTTWAEERRSGTDELLFTLPRLGYRNCHWKIPVGRGDLYHRVVLLDHTIDSFGEPQLECRLGNHFRNLLRLLVSWCFSINSRYVCLICDEKHPCRIRPGFGLLRDSGGSW